MQRPRLQVLHRHKPLQPRLRRLARLVAILHDFAETHALPSGAVEEREFQPKRVWSESREGWESGGHWSFL